MTSRCTGGFAAGIVVMACCLTAWGPAAAGSADAAAAAPDARAGAPAQPAARDDGAPVEHVLEIGAGVGRYDFRGAGTSGFDGEFVRFSRTRPSRDAWNLEVGRQHRFDENSLDGGVSYTRFLGRTSLLCGLSSGTGHVLGPEYRLDLGVTRPIRDVIVSLGYTRLVSKEANRSDGWGISLTRWFPHVIVSVGHRIDIGQPGDTQSSATSLGVTWYRWRKTYAGAGMSFGEVSYLLTGPGAPLVDYYAHDYNLVLTQYVGARTGVNLRYDHGTTNFYDLDGVTVGCFREW